MHISNCYRTVYMQFCMKCAIIILLMNKSTLFVGRADNVILFTNNIIISLMFTFLPQTRMFKCYLLNSIDTLIYIIMTEDVQNIAVE